jgi:hypothetical protein
LLQTYLIRMEWIASQNSVRSGLVPSLLDGHGSHITPEFDQYCLAYSIIVLYMPPHSSRLLQPLDVGCFSVLK